MRGPCAHLALSWHLNSRHKGTVPYKLECAARWTVRGSELASPRTGPWTDFVAEFTEAPEGGTGRVKHAALSPGLDATAQVRKRRLLTQAEQRFW